MSTEDTPLVGDGKKRVVPLDEDYVDHELHMTRARRFSRFMSQFSWYYPHVESEDPNKPSLDKAWAYFEHVALPRYMTQSSNNTNLAKAAPGENAEETKLYPVLSTSEADLADFGIAVGVYFYTLKGLALIMFLAAAINIPVMMYYRSNAYNPGNGNLNRWSLQSSAICTNQEWAPCPTCQLSDWLVFPKTYTRYAETTLPSGQTLPFILLNNCNMSETVGIWSFVSLIFVTVAVFVLREISKRKEKEFDDAQLTTPDYGVEIENPPFDARDPEEWKEFFSQFGPVNTITVVLDNEELTNILVKRRKLVNALENLLPAGVKFDRYDLEGMASQAMSVRFLGKLMCKSSAPKLLEKIAAIDKLVMEDLALRNYNVSEVFVVFETEQAKTSCLNGLAVTGVAMLRNDTSALPPERVFRGKHLLSAVQPPEPTSVRWNDLDETFWTRMCQRTITMLITILLVAGTCVAVIAMRKKYGVVASALTITVSTSLLPILCRVLTQFESHENEGNWQVSLYVKVTFCLWIVSALLNAEITPFGDTVGDTKRSLIPAMYTLFIAEMVKTPIIQCSDFLGNIKRHLLAPRAPDQRRMNRYFQGSIYRLSTRYTDTTKVLFMTLYYAFLFPPGFLFAGITLIVHYWVDKFSLMRKWARAPLLDNGIAKMSRRWFFTTALAVGALMSSYDYASFPFDNACLTGTAAPSQYVGNFTLTIANNKTAQVSVPMGTPSYKYCNQDMKTYAFPATRSNQPAGAQWMKPGQNFTRVYGWACIGVIGFILLLVLRVFLGRFKRYFIAPAHIPKPRPGVNFTDVKDIQGFIPMHQVPGSLFPTILCYIDDIDQTLIGWVDPLDPSHKTHNAIYDIPGLDKDADDDKVFSIVKQWPPEAKVEE